MQNLTPPLPAGKSPEDRSGERDLMLSALRIAATRSRLQVTLFESLHTALRQKRIDCAGAVAQLKQEGLPDRLPPFFGGGQ
jgi:hypothetical protein